jgi:hypothetical protein
MLALSLFAYLTSLCVYATRYGQYLTFTMQEGFFGLYCGGDTAIRNDRLFNGFCAPWDSSGAGGSVPDDMRWEVYGPSTVIARSKIQDAMSNGLFLETVLGLRWPEVRLDADDSGATACAIVFPLWIMAVIAAILTCLRWRISGRDLPGHCLGCGYNLTGNVSGICPECGETI